GGAITWVRARYCAAWSYICPGLVRYACAPSHMPPASGRAELRTVRTTTRRAKIADRAQYNAGRVSTSTAACEARPAKVLDGSSAPMRPIFGFSSSAARSRMPDALAPLLGASPESGPPGSPNLSPRIAGRASAHVAYDIPHC